MRKFYTTSLFLLVFGLFANVASFAQINAVNDTFTINSFSGATNSVLTNDTLNGLPIIPNQIVLTATIVLPGFTLNPNGTITIAPSTANGTYTLTYTICQIGNPGNCDTAIVTITITANNLDAVADNYSIAGSGTVGNILFNDTLSGEPLLSSLVNISFISSTNSGITLLGSSIVVASGTPIGTYTLTYQICLLSNPNVCDTAVVTIIVDTTSTIIANDDTIYSTISGQASVLQNDTLFGNVITSNQVVITQLSSNSSSIGINSSGFIVFSSTLPIPPGIYLLTYQICEVANPNNCDTANVLVNMGACNISTPIVSSVLQPTCTNLNGTVALSGLPSTGNWVLNVGYNGVTYQSFSGSGTTYSLNLPSGYHSITVTSADCISQSVNVVLNSIGGIAVSMTASYTDFNSDGFTNVGDVINYQFTVTNGSCDLITNIYLENNNLNLFGGPISSLPSGASDNSTFTATYVITQADINAGIVYGSVVVLGTLNGNQVLNDYGITTALSLGNGIKLNAFIDSNANGIQDGTEPNVNSGNFTYQINNGVTHTVNSSNGMVFLYESNPSNNYTIGLTLTGYYIGNYTVTPSLYTNVTVATGSGITTYNFPLTVVPYTNVGVTVCQNGAPPRPGFLYQNVIYIQNNGNQTIASGTLTFNANTVVTITSISIAGTTAIANGFTYNYTNLLPGQTIPIYVTMQVPTIPTVTLGQQLTNTASITPIDDYLLNNNSSLTQTIVGSYDPNEKSESHGGRIVHSTFTSNDYLSYTIQFENTGTADAINVRVNDVLDAKLDETSIRMIAASHNYVLDRVGNVLNWKFDGINLPPSVPNTQIGHGSITFEIKPKTGYAVGDIIPNTANIYFDFNPAIVTNTCNTEFVTTLRNDNFAFENFNFYPNPVKNTLTISNASTINNLEITSVLGQKMLSKKVNELHTEINLSSLSNGIYFVKVTSEGQEKTVKIIKE
jgi:uncharacterized repeat protein (TIGR01451 family)